jgi:nucleoside-diphosphate-sugar epimerase
MNIILTGATGFVGRQFKDNSKFKFKRVYRGAGDEPNSIYINQLGSKTNWSENYFDNIDTVIHLAALAHDNCSDINQLTDVNVNGSVTLALAAANAGVKRFIFISSIGVNGVSNTKAFTAFDIPNPTEAYTASKFQAEIELKKIAEDTGMEVVIIRPPLVYGKNAPGSFGTLLKVAEKNLPLPLGAIKNQRSFVAIDNLIDLIVTCIDHPRAANQTFLISDDETISTSNLLKKLTLAAGKKPRLLPVPVSFLKFLASIVGKKASVERFSSSLTVDIEHTKRTLNWNPPITLDEGIRRCFK